MRPPRPASDDSSPQIEVPRLEPPPPSLEAMVQSAPRSRTVESRTSSWLLWVALVVAAALLTAYVTR